MVKPEQEVRAARQDLYNLIAELCSFITKKDSDNYLVSYSCLSEEEELRIEERIEKNTPLAVSSGGAFVVIRDTDLTEEFLKNLRLFSTALVLDDDRNCIMKLLQTLDGALYLILQDEMERMSIHPGHMTENAGPTDSDDMAIPADSGLDALNTNEDEMGIRLIPRCQCVWARKSRQYFSERRLDIYLKYLIVVEKRRTSDIRDRHIFLPDGFFKSFDEKKELVIATTPLTLQSDFSIHFHRHQNIQSFTLDYNRPAAAAINHLVWEKITEAGEKGAEMIVFPEMMGTETMEAAIREKLRKLPAKEQEKIPAMIILPSLFVRGHNFTSIIDRRGNLLARQYKQNPYVMRCRHGNYMEGIEGSDEVVIFHYPGIGRFAVMICKDFLTTRYMERIMRSFKLTLIIVPAYSTGAYDFQTSFETCAHDYCNVVWINSCAALIPGKEKNFRYIGYTRRRISRYQTQEDACHEMTPCVGLFSGKCRHDCLYLDTVGKV